LQTALVFSTQIGELNLGVLDLCHPMFAPKLTVTASCLKHLKSKLNLILMCVCVCVKIYDKCRQEAAQIHLFHRIFFPLLPCLISQPFVYFCFALSFTVL